MSRYPEDSPAPETMWITPESCVPLFGVRPKGGSTPFVEALLSWLVRLAREHAVSPRELVRELIGPQTPKIRTLCYASFFRRHAATVNGLGRYADLFVESLSSLSGAKGLEIHTLLPWRFVIAGQGSPLVSPVQRWCPHCLIDMIRAGLEPYRMLLWSLHAVGICPIHQVTLQDRCTHCGTGQPAIPRWPDILHCDSCRRSLLVHEVSKSADIHLHGVAAGALWQAYAAADLLRCNGLVGGSESPQRLRRFLREISMAVGQGSRAQLCRQVGLPTRALNKWLAGTDRPSLQSLLRLLHAVDYWPSEVLLGDQGPISPMVAAVWRPGRLKQARRVRLEADANTLRVALRSGDPPSLTALANFMGMSRSGLKYRFPMECKTIVEVRCAKRRARVAAKRGDQETAVAQIVLRLGQSGIFPGRKRVELEARKMGFSLLDPNLRRVFQQGLVDWLLS